MKHAAADLLLVNASLALGPRIVPGALRVSGGCVAEIFLSPRRFPAAGAGCRRIDLRGAVLSPGFLDLHINGVLPAVDEKTGWEDFFLRMAFELPRHGVVGFLPTLYSCPFPDMLRRASAAAQVCLTPLPLNARALGLYAEGPFLSPAKPGSHPGRAIRKPSLSALQKLYAASEGTLRVLTLAPELPGADLLAGWCRAKGVLPALGHTAADFETAASFCVRHGVGLATHLFNAMPPLHHRAPGAAAYALLDPRMKTEIIADGRHVHPAFVRLAAAAKEIKNLVLVSDAASLRRGNRGLFFEGRPAYLESGAAYLSSGTLAASTTMIPSAVGFLTEKCGFTLADSLSCATLNPARALGVDHTFGSIQKGRPAYLTALDGKFRVLLTVMPEGIAYEAGRSCTTRHPAERYADKRKKQ